MRAIQLIMHGDKDKDLTRMMTMMGTTGQHRGVNWQTFADMPATALKETIYRKTWANITVN